MDLSLSNNSKRSSESHQMQLSDHVDLLKSKDDDDFYDKITNTLDGILERTKRTENKLSLVEEMKVNKSFRSSKKETLFSPSKKDDNPFTMPVIEDFEKTSEPKQLHLPKKGYLRRPVREPTLEEIYDALTLLQAEINDVRENQEDMEKEIIQIKRLIQ